MIETIAPRIMLLAIGAVCLSAAVQSALGDGIGKSDLATLTQNIRQSILKSDGLVPPQSKAAQEYLQTMTADGSWPDQDYADVDRIHWKAGDHLPRLEKILRAYYQTGTPLSNDPQVLSRSRASLKFWLDHDPKNENWWHNEIGVPTFMGEILMLLGKDAPADLVTRGTDLMKRANWKRQTGANLTDETRIQLMRGLLTGSDELVQQAYTRTWEEVKLAGGNQDGIQVDHSFHQHGPLLYCRGYGTVFVDDIAAFVRYARGTSFIMPADKQELFNNYLLGGPQWMLRGGYWDFGACGRGIVRDNALRGSMLGELTAMATLDGPMQSQLQGIVTRLEKKDDLSEPIGNRQYWRSGYMAHRRADYFASVRMFSTRTLNTDGLTNGENRKTHHIADGATCLMVNGNEYFNIFPVWDWMRIPGTTVEQNVPMVPKQVSHHGKNELAGSVSDGTYGCSAMQLITDTLQAHKAWFCFDDEIICLGSGINCSTNNPVFTSINQCLLHGPVACSTGENLAGKDEPLNGAKWVWHDSIGYLLPESQRCHVKIGPQEGKWSDIGTGTDKVISSDIFGLWIDHEQSVRDGSYSYVILPGADQATTAKAAGDLPIKILRNTPTIQAVWHEKLKIVQAVFAEAGSINAGELGTVQVNQPCLLMVHLSQNQATISASSPTHAAGKITITFSRRFNLNKGEPTKSITVDLPDGLMAGSSVVLSATEVQ